MEIRQEKIIKDKIYDILNQKFLLGICDINSKYGVILNDTQEHIKEYLNKNNIFLNDSDLVFFPEGNIILEDNIVHNKNFVFIDFCDVLKKFFKKYNFTGNYKIIYPAEVEECELIDENIILLEEE